jgi:two-component system, sensor histidine kinase and response regulator
MKKILVIDDAEFILESTSTLLEFEGYDVYTASDGELGVKMAFEEQPDLILCDISMPKLDGYGVLSAIKKDHYLSTIPFVFLTAFAEKANMRAGMAKGADDYIIKPFTKEDLIAAIDAIWKKYTIIDERVQKQVNEVGKNVTYALPHEFRTALNEVIGSAKFLISGAGTISNEEIRETSEDIVYSANRLLKITENFLMYVSIESFASNPERRQLLRQCLTVEPRAIMHDVANVTSYRYNRKSDLVIEDIYGDHTHSEKLMIEISSESFAKLLNELLDNAFRFSETGQKVYLSFIKEGEFLKINIKDEGRGMTPEQIREISALTQFDRALYEQQGVGLGLIVSKKIVEVHDGEFEISSNDDNGVTICFTLPLHL